MKPRFEIHSIGMTDVVEPAEQSSVEQRDRSARALFSATEIVASNKFETEIGKDLPMTKYGEYRQRYQTRFQAQANDLAKAITDACAQNPKAGTPAEIYQQLTQSGGVEFLDPWGNPLRFEPASWDPKNYYIVISPGPDHRHNMGDAFHAILLFQRKRIVSTARAATTLLNLDVEHDRGAMNGKAQIVGTVTDPSGAVVAGANVEVRDRAKKLLLNAITDATGQFSLAAVFPGDYEIQITMAGFQMAAGRCSLRARDRAVISATLSVGQSTETVEVSGAAPMLETEHDLATATATIKNNLSKTAKMETVDLGIPPGFDLLSEDLQDYRGKSAKMNSGHLSKFSLTATQAILYFDAFAPGDTVKVKFRLRAKYPIRVRTFQSRVYEHYDPKGGIRGASRAIGSAPVVWCAVDVFTGLEQLLGVLN